MFRSIIFLEYYPNPLQSFMGDLGLFLGHNFISSIEILSLSDRHGFFFPVCERIKTITRYKQSLAFPWYANTINMLFFTEPLPVHTWYWNERATRTHTSSHRVKNSTQYTVTPPKVLHNLLQGWHRLIAVRWRYCNLMWHYPVALQD